jgi:hypothetical protein
MTKEQYFELCEALGTQPKEEEIPIEISDFPLFVQESIRIFNHLPDRWDSFSGTYFGKDYSILPFLIGLFEVDDVPTLFLFITVAEATLSEVYSAEIKMKRKAKEQANSLNQANKQKR